MAATGTPPYTEGARIDGYTVHVVDYPWTRYRLGRIHPFPEGKRLLVSDDATERVWWVDGKVHREDDKPTSVQSCATEWMIDDVLHREGNPACILLWDYGKHTVKLR